MMRWRNGRKKKRFRAQKKWPRSKQMAAFSCSITDTLFSGEKNAGKYHFRILLSGEKMKESTISILFSDDKKRR
jgi:hypothetical protein